VNLFYALSLGELYKQSRTAVISIFLYLMVEFGVLAKVMKSVENSKKGETFFYVY
jgi:hypothetical protein